MKSIDGDVITLSLHPAVKRLTLNGKQAFVYGNIVLARDEQKEPGDINLPFTPVTRDGRPVSEQIDLYYEEAKGALFLSGRSEIFVVIMQKYATEEGRKVVEDSKKVGDLLKNPNKFFFMVLGIVLLVVALLVAIVFVIAKVVQRVIRKRKRKDAN